MTQSAPTCNVEVIFFFLDLFPLQTHPHPGLVKSGWSRGPTELRSVPPCCFSLCQCSARLGHGAALSALRGSARVLRPPSGFISTLISGEATPARHDHPRQRLGLRGLPASQSLSRPRLRADLPRRCVPLLTRRAAPLRSRSRSGFGSLLVDCRVCLVFFLAFNPWRSVPSLKAG